MLVRNYGHPPFERDALASGGARARRYVGAPTYPSGGAHTRSEVVNAEAGGAETGSGPTGVWKLGIECEG